MDMHDVAAPDGTAGNGAGSGQAADGPGAATASQSPTGFEDASQSPVAAALQTADLEQQASEFRALLAGRATAREETTPAQPGGTRVPSDPLAVTLGELARHASRMRMMREDADASALPSAATTATPDAEAAAAAEADGSLAELFERHVRRALLAVGSDRSGTEEIRIELSDAVLPGTALSLRRAPGGWQLLVSGDNRQSLERLEHHGPSLVKRFASASLGSLEILTAGASHPSYFAAQK
jgi:hypothetical protein